MDTEREPIRPIRDVVREYVETAIARRPELPQYRVAMELGISPTTLIRMRKRWAEEGREAR